MLLKNDQIKLRVFEKNELEPVFRINNEMDSRGQYNSRHLISYQSFFSAFDKNGLWGTDSGWLGIESKSELVGQIGFSQFSLFQRSFLIHYHLYSPKDYNQGITTDAVGLFCEYLFKTKDIIYLFAKFHVDNIASKKVLEKNKFQHSLTGQSVRFHDGAWTDEVLMHRVRD